MKFKKTLAILCSMVLGMGVFLTGCAGTTEQNADTSADVADENVTEEETETEDNLPAGEAVDGTNLFGTISAIDGDTITLALAEQPAKGEKPEGGMQGEEGSTEMPERPEGEEGSTEMPERPEGEEGSIEMPEMPQGDEMGDAPAGDMPEAGKMELTLTGEEQVITIADNTVITVNGETAAIADLAEGDIISVIMDGDLVVSIQVMMGTQSE